MNKIFLGLILVSMSLLSRAQDIGIEQLYYPTEAYQSFELSSYFPVYYQIKNYGEEFDDKVMTLELIAEGMSPRFTQFRSPTIPQGWTAPIDDRRPEFYEFGFHQLVGMSSVMGLITPEASVGDTLHICLVATVEGDVNPTNDTLCFYITLKERKNRDLRLLILSPENDTEVHPHHSVSFDLSIRNDGSESYDNDSIYGQMALEKGGQTLDLINFTMALNTEIEPGDSATATIDVPLSKDFETGPFFMGFRIAWLSDDKVFELSEGNLDNNIRYVRLNATTSSINSLFENSFSIVNAEYAIIIKGNFSENQIQNARMYNMSGRELEQNLNMMFSASDLKINTSNISSGTYILLLEGINGSISRHKVIVD
ncbi:MAG: T9SS type A sorting domain-containing protein [Bacteroidia bacterium]